MMDPNRKVNLGINLLASGKLQEASQYSSKLLTEAPDSAVAHEFASEVAVARNRIDEALGHITRAVEIDDHNPELQFKKANIELIARQGLKAQETVSAVAARFPDDPKIQLRAALVFGQCRNHVGAEAFLLKAGARNTTNPEVLFEFSNNQFFLGKTAEAEKAIEDFLALKRPLNGRKLLLRSQLRKQTPDRNHVDMLKNYLKQPLDKKEAVNCFYALAKELEDLGEYRPAFDALRSGAAIQRQLINFNLAGELKNLTDIIHTFRADAFAGIPDSGLEQANIFIVGMPRTGTTLVERILGQIEDILSVEETYDFTLAFTPVINDYIATHPDRALNPLSAALEVDYRDIGRKYQDNLQGMFGKAERYLDKTPFNFLYCGLISKAFPRARIIHLVRDPMDTCYAVFKTLFAQAYFFSYNLEELADYYIAYRRLMDHWHELMPGAILDVRYEELVSNPEEVSRQIAEHLELPWSRDLVEVQNITAQTSTASAAQVREPIYTSSVGRWRQLASELEPVRKKLAAANIVDASGNSLI